VTFFRMQREPPQGCSVSFDVSADAYGRFMGRFSEPLAEEFVRVLDLRPGQRALDVGCGPGALTSRIVDRLGPAGVTAVDPSAEFLRAVSRRLPGVRTGQAEAEDLPFGNGEFDVSAAQLVVHFMADPVRGLAEMGRVTRAGGLVAACVWDHAGGAGPLSSFWSAVHDVDPSAPGEASLPGARAGHLAELLREAGLREVLETTLTVRVSFETFDEWWTPFTLGVGPAGAYVAALSADRRADLRETFRSRLPDPPFTLSASAWTVAARV